MCNYFEKYANQGEYLIRRIITVKLKVYCDGFLGSYCLLIIIALL